MPTFTRKATIQAVQILSAAHAAATLGHPATAAAQVGDVWTVADGPRLWAGKVGDYLTATGQVIPRTQFEAEWEEIA